MADTMLGGVAYDGERHLKLEEVPIPEPGDADVLIKVEGAGLSTGTLHSWRVLKTTRTPGIISIHGAGTVVAKGQDAFNAEVDERVYVNPVLSCGRCEHCIADRGVSCAKHVIIGRPSAAPTEGVEFLTYSQGSLAQFWRVPASNLNRLPDHLSMPVASKLGTLATSYNALRTADLPLNSTIVLTGATGANGAAVVLQAHLFGVRKIIAIGRSAERLKETQALAPDIVEPLLTEDLPFGWEKTSGLTKEIRDRTGGLGADALLDFLPASSDIVVQAIFGSKTGSVARLFGGNLEELRLPYYWAMPHSQYRIFGGRGHARTDMLQVLQHLDARRMDPTPLVTHQFALREVNDAIDLLDARPNQTRWGVVIEPDA